MKKEHTYNVMKAGSKVAEAVQVSVNYPDTLLGFFLETPDDVSLTESEKAVAIRHASIYAGFISAHHVQSAIKSAYGKEPGKRSGDDLALIKLIEAGETLNGLDFIPDERGSKGDATVQKIRAAAEAGKLTQEVLEKFSKMWSKDKVAKDGAELEGLYLAWKRAQQAQKFDL